MKILKNPVIASPQINSYQSTSASIQDNRHTVLALMGAVFTLSAISKLESPYASPFKGSCAILGAGICLSNAYLAYKYLPFGKSRSLSLAVDLLSTTILTVMSAYFLLDNHYQNAISLYDARLLTKFQEQDCGGLSEMAPKVEGCYKKYLSEALYRLVQTPSPVAGDFYKHFSECFNRRPEYPCSWWGEDVFASKI